MGITQTLERIRRERPDRYRACLEFALDEPDETIQRIVVERLLALGEPRALVPALRQFASLRPAARKILLEQREMLLISAEALLVSPDAADAEAAAQVLARTAGIEDARRLTAALRHESPKVRDIVAPAASRVAAECVALVRRARDGDAATRAQIESIRGDMIRLVDEALARYEEAPDPVYVECAIELGSEAHTLLVLRAAGNPGGPLARDVPSVAASLHSPPAYRFYLSLAADPAAIPRGFASEILRRREGDPAFLTELASYLRSLPPAQFSSLAAKFDEPPWWADIAEAELDEPAAEVHVAFLCATRAAPAAIQARLRALLKHRSAAMRAAAFGALEAARSPHVESAARELLADPSDDVKALAAAALARIGSHDLPQLLAPFVHSAHPRLASIALKVIAQASFDRYLRSFDRLDEATRQAAARAIAKIDASLLDRLHGELAALEPDRRLKALRIAGYAGAGDRLRPFLREVLADPDVKVRATAVKMLGILGGADGLHALIEALNDPDRRIRANAVEAFEEIGDTRFVMLLKPFLADPDNRVRANAAKALHRLGVSEGRETLEQMLESEERLMRLSAAWAMGEIGARAFEAPLRARLPREQDSQVRERIRRALESLEQSDA